VGRGRLNVVLDSTILVSAFLTQDNTIVACALATHAHYIVTRDKDLLDLQSYQGIRILSPERFLTLLRQPRGEQSPDQSP
jgi:predicted nucleic acid-binding protein